MYDELVKLLRGSVDWRSEEKCDGCPYEDYPCCVDCLEKMHGQAADAIEELSMRLHGDEAAIAGMKREIERMVVADKPRWIHVTERLPEHEYGEGPSVLTVDLYGVMRVTYFDGGNWCWPSGETLTTTRIAPITHWMPLPEPPKEE